MQESSAAPRSVGGYLAEPFSLSGMTLVEVAAVQEVDCPVCLAQPGQPCADFGVPVGASAHQGRLDRLEQWVEAQKPVGFITVGEAIEWIQRDARVVRESW